MRNKRKVKHEQVQTKERDNRVVVRREAEQKTEDRRRIFIHEKRCREK